MQLICPICKEPLLHLNKTFQCLNRHNYDQAKSGYVNLLPPSGQGKKHGDDKEMVIARTRFLDGGYYDSLSDAVSGILSNIQAESPSIIDAGCGEGKYTADLYRVFSACGKTPDILGIDVSSEALRNVHRRNKSIQTVVASTAAMPVADQVADVVLNIFSPVFPEEFARVLKKNGLLLRVLPLENHLMELKQLVYENAYENKVDKIELPGFTLMFRQDLRYKVTLRSSDDIHALFSMTPYYYKTSKEDLSKLDTVTSLQTRVEFGIFIYQKQ